MASGPSIVATLGLDAKPLQRGLANAKNDVKIFGVSVSSLMASLGAGALLAAGRNLIAFGDAIGDTADELDLTTTSWQKLVAAFDDAGPDRLAKSISKLNQQIQAAREGNAEVIASFKRMGVSWEELHQLAPEEILMEMADAAKESHDPVALLSDTLSLLGKSGRQMVPQLKEGSDAIRELGEQAEVADDKTIAMAGRASRFFSRIMTEAKTLGLKAMAGVVSDFDKVGALMDKSSLGRFVKSTFVSPTGTAGSDTIQAKQIDEDAVARRVLSPVPLSPEEKAQMKRDAEEARKIGEEALKEEQAQMNRDAEEARKIGEAVLQDDKERADYRQRMADATERMRDAEKDALNASREAAAQKSVAIRQAKEAALINAREAFVADPSVHGEMETRREARRKERLEQRFERKRAHEQAEDERRARTGAVRHGRPGLFDRAQKDFEAQKEKIITEAAQRLANIEKALQGKYKNE